jgi:hypothetical protein
MLIKIVLLLVVGSFAAQAMEMKHPDLEGDPSFFPRDASDCSSMDLWDVGMGMCMPFPMPGMSMSMFMLRANAFATQVYQTGPRGTNGFAVPDMAMADLGTTVADRHYLNVDLMLTAEKWAFPSGGYPELLQIGEVNAQGIPYVDAQHPHSSPIMGLTLSDTIRLGDDKNSIKVFFAPRGESTDGPVAFMHRPTGMVNPDAPLGHHVGQDVGHITSTVIGASLKWGNVRFEASTFHGAEPSPTKVDLPIGAPDSVAARIIGEFTPRVTGLISAAYVANPEPDEPDITSETRYSASLLSRVDLGGDWEWFNTAIYGLIIHMDHADNLSSFGEEFLFRKQSHRIWGRIEVLQRTPEELEIDVGDPNSGRWVGAFTLGYTYGVWAWEGFEVGVGGSVSKYVLPSEFSAVYGSPWAAKIFLQVGGMHMWDL